MCKIFNNPSRNFKPKCYWSSEFSKEVALRRLALKQFRIIPTPQNLKIFKEKTLTAKRNLCKARTNIWHK